MKTVKDKPKTKKSGLVITCYIIAAVMLAAGIFMAVENVIYIKSYADMYGVGVGSMWQELISYIISGAFPYVAYAVIIFMLGKFAKVMLVSKKAEAEPEVTVLEFEDLEEEENTETESEEEPEEQPESEGSATEAVEETDAEEEQPETEEKNEN